MARTPPFQSTPWCCPWIWGITDAKGILNDPTTISVVTGPARRRARSEARTTARGRRLTAAGNQGISCRADQQSRSLPKLWNLCRRHGLYTVPGGDSDDSLDEARVRLLEHGRCANGPAAPHGVPNHRNGRGVGLLHCSCVGRRRRRCRRGRRRGGGGEGERGQNTAREERRRRLTTCKVLGVSCQLANVLGRVDLFAPREEVSVVAL